MSATSDRTARRRPGAPPPADAPRASGGVAPSGAAVEVDASMRLLREVMAHPVDPAYEMAAAWRRSGRGASGRPAMVVTVVLALVCGWVVTRGVTELRRPEPGQAAGRAALEREITRRTARADTQQRTIERLRGEIAGAQQAQLTSPDDLRLARQAEQLAVVTGEIAVTGPGLQITLRDAPSTDPGAAVGDPRAPTGSEDGRVLDRDVQIVVNGLWVAGAEAVAINGRRLTSLSAIRSAGQAILVDFRPLVPPYVISAVGDPAAMQSRFTADKAGSYLQSIRDNYGVGVDIATASRLDLPGAGAVELRSARPVTNPTPSSSNPSSISPSTEVSP